MYPKVHINEAIDFDVFPVLIAIGILFMLIFIIMKLEKKNIDRKILFDILTIVSISLVMSFLSGVFFDSLFHSIEQGKFVFGGMTYIGGFIGGIVTFCILFKVFFKKTDEKLNNYLNIIIPAIVIAHIFGRIGCFFGGCCYGSPTDSFLGVIFPEGSLAALEYGYPVKVYPTQLFEVFALIIILIILSKLKDYKFPYYLILYGVFRFIIEFFRGDNRGSVRILLSPSQLLCLLLIMGGLFILFKAYKKQNENLSYQNIKSI